MSKALNHIIKDSIMLKTPNLKIPQKLCIRSKKQKFQIQPKGGNCRKQFVHQYSINETLEIIINVRNLTIN